MSVEEPCIHIEYIAGTRNAPVVLLWGYDIHGSRELFHAIRALRDGRDEEIAIHKLPRFKPIAGVEIYARMSENGMGFTKHSSQLIFDWQLSDDKWRDVEDALAPFCYRFAAPGPFQWLSNSGKVSLIFSTHRGW